MRITLHGTDLPGRRACPPDGAGPYEDVHVGVQRRAEVVDLVPGDAPGASWTFDVDVVSRPDGTPDVRGPYVHGRPGARFVYLSWGTVGPDGAFAMFRRAKLMFDAVEPALLAPEAHLVGTVGLTMANGTPLCAAVRPPVITWAAGQP